MHYSLTKNSDREPAAKVILYAKPIGVNFLTCNKKLRNFYFIEWASVEIAENRSRFCLSYCKKQQVGRLFAVELINLTFRKKLSK